MPVFKIRFNQGVISRGLRGQSFRAKATDSFGGHIPLNILVLVLLFKVYSPCFQSILHCYDELCTATWLLRQF